MTSPFNLRVRPGGTDEHFEDLEEAEHRFTEVAAEDADHRISLHGPGGVLLRRRPANPGTCGLCGAEASIHVPVTATGTDPSTRRRDVIAVCAEHHAALTATPGEFRHGPWRYQVGALLT